MKPQADTQAFTVDFDDLEDDFVDGKFSPPSKPSRGKHAKNVKFPCSICNGTGLYRGVRVHQEKEHCFACRGQGFFLTSQAERDKKRQQRVISKARKAKEEAEAFDEQNPGIREFLKGASEWSEFAASLYTQLNERRSLSEKQLQAIRGMIAKIESRKQAKAKEKEAPRAQIDLTPIRTMFEAAVASGYKRPAYRAEGLVINRAPDTGRNPGALYVKNEADEYGGKILGTEFLPTREGRASDFTGQTDAVTALQLIAKDPLEAALRYGQRTGRCACCGRELTNHESIDLGIGPVCREKWGL